MGAPATITLNGRKNDTTGYPYSPIIIFPSLCNRQKIGGTSKKSLLPYCGGPLHFSNYQRKPRGGPPELQEVFEIRFSLCCGREGCRRRTTPPSVRFWGRRVYWAPVVVLVTALRQGKNPAVTLERLKGLCSVWRSTVNRWRDYFLNIFPKEWSRHPLSGRIMLQASDCLLQDLLAEFSQRASPPEIALASCLQGLIQGP
jgi:hypothetical protein